MLVVVVLLLLLKSASRGRCRSLTVLSRVGDFRGCVVVVLFVHVVIIVLLIFTPARSRWKAPLMPLLNVVLHQPDIPQNTGNIGRTCVAVGAKLWLVRPLGFRLDDRSLKRAGMDYWQHLDWEAIDSLEEVERRLPGVPTWCIEESGTRPVWEASFGPGDVLLFGSETRGLPGRVLEADPSRTLFLPMRREVRSLNLASTVNTVVYEAVRQFGGLPDAGRDLRQAGPGTES